MVPLLQGENALVPLPFQTRSYTSEKSEINECFIHLLV